MKKTGVCSLTKYKSFIGVSIIFSIFLFCLSILFSTLNVPTFADVYTFILACICMAVAIFLYIIDRSCKNKEKTKK